LVDSRGKEKEFHDNHIGVFAWLPGSIRQKIADLLQQPVYSVAREINGDIQHRTQGKRIFIQTGERDDRYVLTFEIMDENLCNKINAILDEPVTDELRAESEADYHRNVELLENHEDIPTYIPKEVK
jgi:hypothetical protein